MKKVFCMLVIIFSTSGWAQQEVKIVQLKDLPSYYPSCPNINYAGNPWRLIKAGSKVKIKDQTGYVCTSTTAEIINKEKKHVPVQWNVTIRNDNKENIESYRCAMFSNYNGFCCDGSSGSLIETFNTTAEEIKINLEHCS